MSAPLIAERLHELLHYSPATGTFTWRVNRGRNAKAGTRAGNIDSKGYRKIGIDGREYRAGRLAYLYMRGEWPKDEIDHRDCDPDNDRWLNLRPATHSQNCANKRPHGLLPKGARSNREKFQARIEVHGVRRWLGSFPTPELASAAYATAAVEAFGEFARVSPDALKAQNGGGATLLAKPEETGLKAGATLGVLAGQLAQQSAGELARCA